MRTRLLIVATGVLALQACASMGNLGNLGALIQPPHFEQVRSEEHTSELQSL